MRTVQVEYHKGDEIYLDDITVDLDNGVGEMMNEIRKILERRYGEIDYWYIKKWYE